MQPEQNDNGPSSDMRFPCLSLSRTGAIALVGLTVFAGSAGAGTAPVPLRILFVGNSHLFVNDVPSRVRRHLQKPDGKPIEIRTFAYGGAQLSQHTRHSDVVVALERTPWDVVVLQEATATFLTADGRRRFHRSVDWFHRHAPAHAQIVLYQTWPWQTGSRYLRGLGKSSRDLWHLMLDAYGALPERARVVVAPVGACWVQSSRRATYYSSDGNHASLAGSRVAATVIARTIESGVSGDC